MFTKIIIELIINTFKDEAWCENDLENTVLSFVVIVLGISLMIPAGILLDVLCLPLELIGVIIYLIDKKKED